MLSHDLEQGVFSMKSTVAASGWSRRFKQQPRLWTLTCAFAVAAVMLTVWSVVKAVFHTEGPYAWYAFAGGTGGFIATALGAAVALALREISAKVQDVMLGFAGGMMLAASTFSLILPGLEAARTHTDSAPLAASVVIAGLALGVALMLALDNLVPHEHETMGRQGPTSERIHRVWLFVLAITLHNLPEGMAIGVSLSNGDLGVGIPLTSAILLQDIPEGLAVAMSLRATGLSAGKAALVAMGSGLMEPLGAIIGLAASTGFAWSYPVSMGIAAGAMIFVVSHEVIPETHRNGHQTPATLGLMLGFAVMMFMDTALN
jgi:ZIP family zinc transporter